MATAKMSAFGAAFSPVGKMFTPQSAHALGPALEPGSGPGFLGQAPWLPVTHEGELVGSLGSWIQPVPAPGVMGILGVDQGLGALSLSFKYIK